MEILPRGRRISTLFLEKVWARAEKVKTSGEPIFFTAPDWLSKYRADSFYEKEPETIAFLNTLTKDSIFWDVGANIGIYSIYAGKVLGARVFSFEPSMMNLEILFRNIQRNNLGDQVTIVPIALSNKNSALNLFMSRDDLHWAGAHNSIGSNTSFTGEKMKNFVTQKQISCTGESMIKVFDLTIPTHIKIDVDGLEGDVIEGLGAVIDKIEYFLVEVDDSNKDLDKKIKRLFEAKKFIRLRQAFGELYVGNQLWKNQKYKR